MNEKKETDEPKIVIKNNADLQRLKLSKLMKNPNKPVIIPERPKDRGVPIVPDFVRNVMGSSAGAGSGEFHVYRHLRRKEYARQKFMQQQSERETLDNEFLRKIEENKKLAEMRTEKKRLKRLKKKNKQKLSKKNPKKVEESEESGSDESMETEENASCIENEENVEGNNNKDIEKDVEENSNEFKTMEENTEDLEKNKDNPIQS